MGVKSGALKKGSSSMERYNKIAELKYACPLIIESFEKEGLGDIGEELTDGGIVLPNSPLS